MAFFRTIIGKIVAGLILGTIVAAIVYQVQSTPQPVFESMARVWVQFGNMESMAGAGGQASIGAFMNVFNSPIVTAAEVMKSTVVLSEAVDTLRGKIPESQLPSIDAIRGSLRVEAVRDADILTVYFKYGDQWMCLKTLEAILEAFLKVNTQQSSANAIQTRIFLQRQLKDAQDDLKAINEETKEFQLKEGVVNINEQVTNLVQQLSNAEHDIEKAKADIEGQQARINFFNSRIGIEPAQVLSAEEIATDEIIEQLKFELASLEIQLVELSGKLKPEHPRIRKLNDRIKKIQDLMQQRVKVLMQKSGISSGAAGLAKAGPVQSKGLLNIVDGHVAQLVDQVRMESSRKQLTDLEAKFKTLPKKQLEYADILRRQKLIVDRVSELEKSLGSAELIESIICSGSGFKVIDEPRIISSIIPKRSPKYIVVLGAFFMAVVLGFFVLDFIDPRLRRVGAVLKTLPLPAIGWMTDLPSAAKLEESLEPMHRLRLALKSIVADDRKQIVVTSADLGDGKSVVAAGLALSYAQSGAKVILVDADFAKASIHKIFKLNQSPGLSDYLAAPEPVPVQSILQRTGNNLWVLTAGTAASSERLLGSSNLADLISQLQRLADIVVFDTPATSQSASAFALLGPLTNLLVVVKLGYTAKPNLRLLSTQLRQHEFAYGGMVISNVDEYALADALSKATGESEDDEG